MVVDSTFGGTAFITKQIRVGYGDVRGGLSGTLGA